MLRTSLNFSVVASCKLDGLGGIDGFAARDGDVIEEGANTGFGDVILGGAADWSVLLANPNA